MRSQCEETHTRLPNKHFLRCADGTLPHGVIHAEADLVAFVLAQICRERIQAGVITALLRSREPRHCHPAVVPMTLWTEQKKKKKKREWKNDGVCGDTEEIWKRSKKKGTKKCRGSLKRLQSCRDEQQRISRFR